MTKRQKHMHKEHSLYIFIPHNTLDFDHRYEWAMQGRSPLDTMIKVRLHEQNLREDCNKYPFTTSQLNINVLYQ